MRYFIVTYLQNKDGKYNESIHLDTKLKDKVIQTATIILDYKERNIVKSRYRDDSIPKDEQFDKISAFYKTHYPDVIGQLETKYMGLDEAITIAREIMGETAITAEDVITDSESE